MRGIQSGVLNSFSKGGESGRMMLGLCTQEFHRRLGSLVLCANQQCFWRERLLSCDDHLGQFSLGLV